jgi:hypothetical protein
MPQHSQLPERAISGEDIYLVTTDLLQLHEALRPDINYMMANAMYGCAPTAQPAVEHIGTVFGGDLALLPTKGTSLCSNPPCGRTKHVLSKTETQLEGESLICHEPYTLIPRVFPFWTGDRFRPIDWLAPGGACETDWGSPTPGNRS